MTDLSPRDLRDLRRAVGDALAREVITHNDTQRAWYARLHELKQVLGTMLAETGRSAEAPRPSPERPAARPMKTLAETCGRLDVEEWWASLSEDERHEWRVIAYTDNEMDRRR